MAILTLHAQVPNRDARSNRRAALALWLALGVSACNARALDFGQDPDFEWWTSHETGDLRDWQAGPKPGGFVFSDLSSLSVVSDVAHSGKYALRARGVSPTTAGWTTAIAARGGPLPTDAHYSAWYYLPTAFHPRSYWLYFLFRSRTPPYDEASVQNEYGLSFRETPDGKLVSVLAKGDSEIAPVGDVSVPIGQWFQISAHLHAASDDSGRLSIWQDDALVFDLQGPTVAATYVEWLLGGVIEGLESEPAFLYIDDAAITRRRLTLSDPPFTSN